MFSACVYMCVCGARTHEYVVTTCAYVCVMCWYLTPTTNVLMRPCVVVYVGSDCVYTWMKLFLDVFVMTACMWAVTVLCVYYDVCICVL